MTGARTGCWARALGFVIHAIAIGDDADQTVLKKIAGAAHGRFWLTTNEKDVVNVYRDIAAYF